MLAKQQHPEKIMAATYKELANLPSWMVRMVSGRRGFLA